MLLRYSTSSSLVFFVPSQVLPTHCNRKKKSVLYVSSRLQYRSQNFRKSNSFFFLILICKHMGKAMKLQKECVCARIYTYIYNQENNKKVGLVCYNACNLIISQSWAYLFFFKYFLSSINCCQRDMWSVSLAAVPQLWRGNRNENGRPSCMNPSDLLLFQYCI